MTKPMHEPTFLILTALLDGPLHGYAVLTRVEELSDSRVRLRVGTLYAALDRLATEGLVAVEGEEVVQGRRRRTYRITDVGAVAVADEAGRMAMLAHRARSRLRARPATVGATVGGAR